MSIDSTSVLAARWVMPIVSDAIYRGWVRLQGEEVVEIGQGSLPGGATDLGDVALLPGLVNAHTHLEFSDLQQPIGQPGITLSDWIAQVVAVRGIMTPQAKHQSILAGLQESQAAGVRLIGEITTAPCEYPVSPNRPELITFAEVLGLSAARSQERLNAATVHNDSNANGGWSPHSPYSTNPDVIHRCVDLAIATRRPLAMHVAESPAERELITGGTGPLAEALKTMGVWQDGIFPWRGDGFMELIKLLGRAERGLLIHGNDLRDEEIRCLASYPNLSVVYCPRTHAFFRYTPHPVDRLIRSGIRVAIGTDSRASNPDLNIWQEVQYLLNSRDDLAPLDVIAMATINGADALGRCDQGRIAIGCRPGFGTVMTDATNVDELNCDFARRLYSPWCPESHA